MMGFFYMIIYVMKSYGYLFGVIKVVKDTRHDEVFVERNNHVIIRNNRYLCDYDELVAIARSLGVNPWQYTLMEDIKNG